VHEVRNLQTCLRQSSEGGLRDKGGDVTTSKCILCLRCVEMCPEDDCLKFKVAGKSVFKSEIGSGRIQAAKEQSHDKNRASCLHINHDSGCRISHCWCGYYSNASQLVFIRSNGNVEHPLLLFKETETPILSLETFTLDLS